MYKSILNVRETQVAVKQVKDYFQNGIENALNLTCVAAPIVVAPESGLNDCLNGSERPVEFDLIETNKNVQIVQSLAKWKRYALGKYGFSVGEGLYTNMNAIRRDEYTDAIHSIYVDQWDWEKVITKEQRNLDTLHNTVYSIYDVLKNTQDYINGIYTNLKNFKLPDEITFISTQELEDLYPELLPKERENIYTREKGAICVTKIGDILTSGQKHDGRSPDYDDWTMNCDIVLYNPVLDIAFEVSSMGIRVDEQALAYQLKAANCEERSSLPFHKAILNKQLPYSIGGGIGQSRLCMYFLQKLHIGEVQVSVWPETEEGRMQEYGCSFL